MIRQSHDIIKMINQSHDINMNPQISISKMNAQMLVTRKYKISHILHNHTHHISPHTTHHTSPHITHITHHHISHTPHHTHTLYRAEYARSLSLSSCRKRFTWRMAVRCAPFNLTSLAVNCEMNNERKKKEYSENSNIKQTTKTPQRAHTQPTQNTHTPR